MRTGIGQFNAKLFLACVQVWGVSFTIMSQSEEIRIRYKYRTMILSGKVKISLDAARALVGPDRAYHLYGFIRPSRKRPSCSGLR